MLKITRITPEDVKTIIDFGTHTSTGAARFADTTDRRVEIAVTVGDSPTSEKVLLRFNYAQAKLISESIDVLLKRKL